MIRFEWRNGFGFDVESNDTICYNVLAEDGEQALVQFDGIIIKLPFCRLEIGNFYQLEDWKLNRTYH
jgi:hypothetical protein